MTDSPSGTQPGDEIIGRTFSHYRVVEKLGGGGMGVVYRAEDVRLGRSVALKFLPELVAHDPDALERFRREALAASSLNHPNICTVFDIGEQDGRPFIVMERLEGATLQQRLKAGPLPINVALDVAVQVLSALEAAHAKGIVHRDIKPPNLFVTDDGHVKILDFGVAKLSIPSEPARPGSQTAVTTALGESTLTRRGEAIGTIAYMSPEQARGEPVDRRTDLFSLGAVFYETITGRPAFPQAFNWRAPARSRELEPPLYTVVLKLLDEKPERRYPTAREALTDIKAVQARRESARPSRRWWLAAAVVIAVASAAAVLMLLRRQAPRWEALELTRVTSDAGLTAYPALSPDGKLLAYASDRAGGVMNIWVQAVAGGDPVRVTQDAFDDTDPSFSPDGSTIAFRSERDGGGISIVSARGGDPRRVAPLGRRPRFSPDGRSIAYWIGERHQFSRNALYVVPVAGGEPRRIAPTFFSADMPSWSPDGRYVLFLGAENDQKPVSDRYDWWIAPVDGGSPVPTGALTALNAKGVFPVWREPGDWAGDAVVFAASTTQYAASVSAGAVSQSSIWSIRLAANPWRVAGEPWQVTAATGIESQPSLTLAGGGGWLAVASTNGNNMEVWSLPVHRNDGAVTGDLQRLTNSVVDNTYATVSSDGALVAFASDRHKNGDIVLKDLRTGGERALTATTVNEFSPFFSADGTELLYYVWHPERNSFSFWTVRTAGGTPREICSDCNGPLYGWSRDMKTIIYRDFPSGRSRVRARRIDSGRDEIVLEHPALAVTFPRLSADERWILFQTVISQTQRQIFAAPLSGWSLVPRSQWVAVTDGNSPDRNAVWAPDGNLVYFLSERDGFRCFWAERLDPASKRPVGDAFPVHHFHQARRSFAADDFAGTYLSVAADKIVFPMRERTGNVWLATLGAR